MVLTEIITRARKEQREILTEIEAKEILEEAGISCSSTKLASTRDEAISLSDTIGYPVVLKVSSVDITHKSDAGGVKVGLKDSEAVSTAYDEILASARMAFPDADIEGVSVQPMADPGTEVIIGMTKDPSFGAVLMFGLGGIFVEVLKDVSFRIVPLDRRDAKEMIREIKGRKLLEGYRGNPAVDSGCLETILLKLSELVERTPGISEIDMNPIFAYENGAVVVDARIILESI